MRKSIFIIFSVLLFLNISHQANAQRVTLQSAVKSYQAGNYDKAVDLLETTISQDSTQLNAYILLGASYLKQDLPTMAQLRAEEGLQHFSDAGALLWIKAEALFQQQLADQALLLYSNLYSRKIGDESLRPLQVNQSMIQQRLIDVHKVLASQAFERKDFEEAKIHLNKLSELDPEQSEVQKNLAYLYFQEEQWDKALEKINLALNVDPNNRNYVRLKASILYKLKDYEGLKDEYQVLYNQNPKDIQTALTYAEILIATQESSQARNIYDSLLDWYPDDRRIYEAIIKVNERQLNISGKREVLRRMEQQFPEDHTVSEDIAATYEVENKWSEARAVYDSLTTVTSNNEDIQKKIARTYVEQDSLHAAKAIYALLYKSGPNDKDLILRYGKTLENIGAFEEAHNLYEEYLSKQVDAEILYRSGVVLMALRKNEIAIDRLRSALKEGNKNPHIYYRLSKLLVREGENIEEARSNSISALRLTLDAVQKKQQLIQQQLNSRSLASQFGDRSEVEELQELNRLAQQSFNHFTDINSKERISKTFKQLEKNYPGSGRLLYLIGQYYQRNGRLERAKSYYEDSLRYNPKNRDAQLAMANLAENMGDATLALVSYERALSLDPDKPEAYDALIRLYRKKGELNTLCDRWLARYRAETDNKVLKEYLIEALHKAEQYDKANEIIGAN